MRSSLFWQFSKKEDFSSGSILFGTMHLYTENIIAIKDRAVTLLEDYSHFYAESDLDHLSQMSAASISFSEMMKNITKSQIRVIEHSCKHYLKLDFSQLSHLRPLFIVSMIQRTLLKEVLLQDTMDQQLWNTARSKGMKLVGLESATEQQAYLSRMSIEEEYHQLYKTCTHISKTRTQLLKLIKLYESQQIHKLYQKTRSGLGKNRQLMIHERNELLANRIDKYHEDSPAFFCLGAGHLSGAVGILRKLKKSGYFVRPI